jgi:RNA polymerase sigma factor (sigma-70 family)
MANGTSALLIRSIHDLAGTRGAGELPDRDLVERFAACGDAEAFAALVRRHGAMVLGVCRRIVRHEQDAEDVFQAVFLVLSRKAGRLRRQDAVGPWLFGVAHRLALRARQKGRERQEREARVPAPTPGEPLDELTLREARTVLDEELARLPERLRGPLILCYLEGLTRDEAAARLGCAPGTLKGRLQRGRAALERRLTRRGLEFLGVLPALALARESASTAAALLAATIRAALAFAGGREGGVAVSPVAAALAEGVLRPTFAGKFAVVAAVLGVVACGFGAGLAVAPPDGAGSEAAVVTPKPERAGGANDGSRVPPLTPPARIPVPVAPPPTEKVTAKEKQPEPLPTTVNGVAKAVDAGKGALTVAHRDGEDTFAVTADARIEIDGAPGKLAGLPAGANVSLTRFVDARTAGSVRATGRSYFGNLVRAVDVPNRTVTIRDKPGDSTFVVAPTALIWVDGKAAKLDAVPPGVFVNLDLAADQRTVRCLGADGPGIGGCGGSMVTAVDVRKRTITFDKKAAPDVAGKTFAIAADALITINGNRTGTLADVPVGCHVGLALRVDGKTVGRVHALGPSNLCDPGGSVLKAVDAEKGTITFDDGANRAVAGKTFSLAKDANVIVDGKAGKLSVIPPGTFVEMRLWVDRRTVGELRTPGQPVPGTGVVTAVDAHRHTITVGGKTYPVARDATIQIDGKPTGLSGVPVGISVALKLNVDRKTVGTIFQAAP